jgi:hypothetical protein
MPIRTNRGRGAVYRRLWGWPLRSPGHLVVSLIGLAAVIIAIAVVSSHVGPAKPKANSTITGMSSGLTSPGVTSGNAGSSSAGPATSPATRLAAPPETPSSAAPPKAALDVITAWGNAWASHTLHLSNDQWRNQLAPYTTPEFLNTDVMKAVIPDNIPATQVTGAPQVVHSYTNSIEVLLPTNGGTLDIHAVLSSTGWQVDSYNPGSGP